MTMVHEQRGSSFVLVVLGANIYLYFHVLSCIYGRYLSNNHFSGVVPSFKSSTFKNNLLYLWDNLGTPIANDLWFSKVRLVIFKVMLQLNLILWTCIFNSHVLITTCLLTTLHDCLSTIHKKIIRLNNSYVCDADSWIVTNSMEVWTFCWTYKWM